MRLFILQGYRSWLFASMVLVSACSSQLNISGRSQNTAETPTNWQQAAQTEALQVEDNWLQQLKNPQVFSLVKQALANNQQLQQQGYDVAIKKQQLLAAGAPLWPSLDLSASAGRNKNNRPVNYSNASSLSLDVSYELDLWGKLSAAERQSNLDYLAEQANFEQAKQRLVGDVVSGWFAVISAQKLLALYQRREVIAEQNLSIIEGGYRQGLGDALDVYLTRNELNNERSRIAAQRAAVSTAIRKLERLLGDYPAAALAVTADLPLLDNPIPLGLPSELLTRKPSLLASWYQLLATDAGLAYAHKARFPSVSLSASLGDSSDSVSDLFSPSSLAWSLMGNITAPLFNGGRLAAKEEQAKLVVKRQEQSYLQSLYDAFAAVENTIALEQSLLARYQTTVKAAENALAAEKLSFEQYLSGLVSYTTVLDAQDRSFEAQSSVIEIKNQLIANRIDLHIALGGDFAEPAEALSE